MSRDTLPRLSPSCHKGERVVPTFRPDDLIYPNRAHWRTGLETLSARSGIDIVDYKSFLAGLEERRAAFVAAGVQATDHGHDTAATTPLDPSETERIFAAALQGSGRRGGSRGVCRQHAPQERPDVGAPWWFLDSPGGMARFGELVIETAGFYNTSGFVDDTRAFASIPARHDLPRRIDAGYLANLVAEHRLTLDEAAETATDLTHRLPSLPTPGARTRSSTRNHEEGSAMSTIERAEVLLTSPGRNFVTLRITTSDGVTDLGDATLRHERRRRVSWTVDESGMVPLHGRLPGEEGAVLVAALNTALNRQDAEDRNSARALVDVAEPIWGPFRRTFPGRPHRRRPHRRRTIAGPTLLKT